MLKRKVRKVRKYRNRKCEYRGLKFDSKKEMYRFIELYNDKSITKLERQVAFVIIPKSKYGRAVKYIADFVYVKDRKLVVEDCKSLITITPLYKIKKRLMAEKYGIIVKEYI